MQIAVARRPAPRNSLSVTDRYGRLHMPVIICSAAFKRKVAYNLPFNQSVIREV